MPNITSFVVVPFVHNQFGVLTPGQPKEAPNREAARSWARAVAAAAGNVGAVALCRTGDGETGVFAKGVMVVGFGDFDLDALSE